MTKDRLAGAARPAQVDKRDGGVTDGIRGTDTEKKSDTHLHYVTDGIRGTDTDCLADDIGVLIRTARQIESDTSAEFIREKMEFEGLKERLLNCEEKRDAVEKRLSEVNEALKPLYWERKTEEEQYLFDLLMGEDDDLEAEYDELTRQQGLLVCEYVEFLKTLRRYREDTRFTIAKPKDVEDVVEVEELVEQVGPEPSTFQTLQVEPHKNVADVEDVKDELDEQVGPRPSTLQALVMDEDAADVEDVKDELDSQVGPRPSTLQASMLDDSHGDDMMEGMKDELVTQVEPRQDTLQALVDKPHGDVANVAVIMEELDEQVEPGSNTSRALIRMEDTHLRSLHGEMTCVSRKRKEDGPNMGMRKKMASLPTPWRTFPWMHMMRPCTLMEQGTWDDADLVEAIWDPTLDGPNARDKGGT